MKKVDTGAMNRLEYCILFCEEHPEATVPQVMAALRKAFDGKSLAAVAICHVMMNVRRGKGLPEGPTIAYAYRDLN